MKEHRPAVLVPELLEEGETLLPQPLSRVIVAGDGEAAAVAAQCMGAQLGRDDFGTAVFEERREPANALARVVCRPEHVHRDRKPERELDRSVREGPGEGGADVVLFGVRDCEVLAARRELASLAVGGPGGPEEEGGVGA